MPVLAVPHRYGAEHTVVREHLDAPGAALGGDQLAGDLVVPAAHEQHEAFRHD